MLTIYAHMNTMLRLKNVILFINVLIIVHCLDYIGNHCIHKTTQQSGKCVSFRDCPSAVAGLKNRIIPQICGFEGKHKESVICCVDQIQQENEPCDSTHMKGEFIEPLSKRLKMENLGLSEKKCEEYLKLGPLKSISLRIGAGGIDSEAKQFPHMAALGYGSGDKTEWYCGGSLISEQYILTAAHCLSSLKPGEARFVRLGDLNLEKTTDDAKPQNFRVIQEIIHPDYEPPYKYNDIAILKLHRPANYTRCVRPACLHTKKQLPTCHLFMTGWGALDYGGSTHDHLQNVDLKYYTNANCRRTYTGDVNLNKSIVDDLQICAGGYEYEKDACQGDSGGPLQYPISHDLYGYFIVGVTSFGKGCATAHIPGVYTRVSHYVPWIEKSIWSS